MTAVTICVNNNFERRLGVLTFEIESDEKSGNLFLLRDWQPWLHFSRETSNFLTKWRL